MPELPEVETTIKGLRSFIGSYIVTIILHRNNLRYPIPKKKLKVVKNVKILSINRLAKYILLNLNNSYTLIVHLGMSGRLKAYFDFNSYEKNTDLHDHVELILNKKARIVFNDPRRFGIFDICRTDKINDMKYFRKLGLDPFNKNFNEKYLYNIIKKSNSPIKSILLNQKVVLGIGNIYANEILFDSRISPIRKGSEISFKKTLALVISIKKILRIAIKSNGSTLKNYFSVDGTLGSFQNKFKVYGKDERYIRYNGKNMLIKKIIQSGRSTYFCPGLQK